jgi:hypothetical protein
VQFEEVLHINSNLPKKEHGRIKQTVREIKSSREEQIGFTVSSPNQGRQDREKNKEVLFRPQRRPERKRERETHTHTHTHKEEKREKESNAIAAAELKFQRGRREREKSSCAAGFKANKSTPEERA